jgi:endonuclease/exonuclease/phosphatase family metal-dependent hydrolase
MTPDPYTSDATSIIKSDVASPGRRRWVTVLAWTLATPLILPACAWVFSEFAWSIDLVANLGAQFLLLSLTLTILIACLRRRGPLLLAIAACLLHLPPLFMHRAAYLPRSATEPSDSRSADVVRILHYNDSTHSDTETIRRLMASSGADVMHILCPPVKTQNIVIYGDGLRDEFPGRLLRQWRQRENSPETKITAAFVVSHWPITPVVMDTAREPMSDRLLAGIVERPGGRFAVIAMHPISPRTAVRWEEGNAVVNAAIHQARSFRAQGLPLVLLGDLNSTPTGHRSRLLCAEAGLSRAKPLFTLVGTYPDRVQPNLQSQKKTPVPGVWPMRLAIDDAVVSPDIRVVGWSVLPEPTSEHSPVIIEISVPSSPMSPLAEEPHGPIDVPPGAVSR